MWRRAPAGSRNPIAARRSSCLGGGERALLLRQAGDGAQQRTVEQAGVDLTHLASHRSPSAPHTRSPLSASPVPLAMGPQAGGSARHQMRPAELAQLETMLHEPEQPIVVGERRRRRPARCSRPRRARRGLSSVHGCAAIIGEAMHELQQLHGELDVAQAAGAEFELVRGRPRDRCAPSRARACAARSRRSPVGRRWTRSSGCTAAMYSAPSSASPASGRALSRAWNSQLFASGRSRPDATRASGPEHPGLPSGRSAASTSHSGGSTSIASRLRIVSRARRVAMSMARASVTTSSSLLPPTKITSTSLT